MAEEKNQKTGQKGLEFLLRTELRRYHINELFDTADRLAQLGDSPLTEAEVEAEIQAVRNKRRKGQ